MSNIVLQKEFESQTYNARIRIYEHSKTKAPIIHVLKDDPENTFMIAFRTGVASSKGFAHILEHSVLSGSKNYKVKEPFVELLKTSIATYINASTYSDKTIYPVSSTNLQDHLNLMGVYLDGVFNPNISEDTLSREGWHIHLENPEDKAKFQGVVFNEMKGAYGDFDREIYEKFKSQLFQGTFLEYSSGGIPNEIIKLKYDEFIQFYKDHYHPSNSITVLYGDHDITQKLSMIEEYFDNYEYKEPSSVKINDVDFKEKRVHYLPINSDIIKEKPDYFSYCFGIKLCSATDYSEKIKLSIVNNILMSGLSSKLWVKLSELDICEEIMPLSDGLSFDSSFEKLSFGFGLKHLKIEDKSINIHDYTKQKTRIITQIISQIAQEKFTKLEIESVLNQFNFYFKEMFNKTSGRSFGREIIEDYFFEGGLDDIFEQNKIFEKIKEEYQNDNTIFDQIYERYFVNNPNTLELFLIPDIEDHKRNESFESQYLDSIFDPKDSKMLQKVLDNTKKLELANKKVDSKENLDSIPSLKIGDLERLEKPVNFEIEGYNNFDLLKYSKDSNGILYGLMAFDISFLPYEVKKNISSFVDILALIDTEKSDYQELSQKVDYYFGSLSFDTIMQKDIDGKVQEYLTISFRCLEEYFEKCTSLIKEISIDSKPVKERLNYLLSEKKSGILSSVMAGELGYLTGAIQSQLDPLHLLIDHNYGLLNIQNLDKLLTKFEYFNDLFTQFKSVFKYKPILSLAGSKDLISKFTSVFESNFNFETLEQTSNVVEFEKNPQNLVYKAPINVNFIAFGGDIEIKKQQYEFGLISSILSKYYLWDEVRIAGGAYGSRVSIDWVDQFIAFNSYRDPHFDKTIETFKNSYKYLSKIDEVMLEKAKISIIGKLDYPKTISQMPHFIFIDFVIKTSNDFRQTRRDILFEVSLDHIKQASKVIEKSTENAIFASFMSEKQIEKSELLKGENCKIIDLFKKEEN
jgi:Zn-dependent M16 (insulinase) family peptidase